MEYPQYAAAWKSSTAACALMLPCTCVKACKGNCKCFKAEIRCANVDTEWCDGATSVWQRVTVVMMLCVSFTMFLFLLHIVGLNMITEFLFLVCRIYFHIPLWIISVLYYETSVAHTFTAKTLSTPLKWIMWIQKHETDGITLKHAISGRCSIVRSEPIGGHFEFCSYWPPGWHANL